MQEEMQTIYQLMFLLTDHKAGVGEGAFIWHYNKKKRDGIFSEIPCEIDDHGVEFTFPLSSFLYYSDTPSFFGGCVCRWLSDDYRINLKETAHFTNFYFLRKCHELSKTHKRRVIKLDCQWQYLSMSQNRLDAKALMQQVLTNGLMYLLHGNFASKYLAREVVKKGVISINWDGKFYPQSETLNFLLEYTDR